MKNYCSPQNPNPVKVGDLFNMSWGYDQTNNNFFQVTRVSPAGVWVREIGCKGVDGTQGFMCENVVPVKDNFLTRSQWCGEQNVPTFRRIGISTYNNSNKPYFNFHGRYFAYPTTATETHYDSWYA